MPIEAGNDQSRGPVHFHIVDQSSVSVRTMVEKRNDNVEYKM